MTTILLLDVEDFAGRQAGLMVYVATYFFLRQGLQFCDALPFNVLLPGQAVNGNAYLVRLNEQPRAAADAGGAGRGEWRRGSWMSTPWRRFT